ncbi:MAG: hypothetical protein KDC38_01450 [Planctomycetes bacterium]|nr:hypothetical protein [Planctomycetota bacterium]
MGKTASHRWSFYRAGGVDQVRLDKGADIVHLDQLDQKLWVALSCPVQGLHFDERTLDLLDTDDDGRVRAPEIVAATQWLGEVLKSPDELVKGRDSVSLSAINTSTPDGKQLLASAKHVLSGLGKPDETSISVEDASQATELVRKGKYNGDGVVPAASIDDDTLRAVAEDVIKCTGGVPDLSGAMGFDKGTVDKFFAECAAFDAWHKEAESDAGKILPMGDKTAKAAAVVEKIEAKVDDYFARCRLAAFDSRAVAALNRGEEDYLALAAQDLKITADEVAGFPLATIEADKPLPLERGVNPAWAGAAAALRDVVGSDSLTEAAWLELKAKLAPYRKWASSKKGATVEPLGIDRVRAITGGNVREVLGKCIDADLALAKEVEGAAQVERLARYCRDLHTLLNNFVSFTHFYSREAAIFQAGTLYLDGRACELCIKVADAGQHSGLAAMAKTYLAYVDCTRPSGEKMTVACAFTSGDSDNLFVGRNGLFYDRDGRDWDAKITKIIDNPISIRQAFWSPYKKLLRWIEESIAKKAAAADAAASSKLQSAATAAGDAAKGEAPKEKPKFDVGTIAALGVAVGGITAALAGVFGALSGMEWWKLPLVLIGVLLAISGPSMVIAWLKLRQRNLGPILDANGWAVNALTKVNIPLGTALTGLPFLPPGSQRSLKDPYAPKKSIWPRLILFLLILAGILFGLWHFRVAEEHWPDWLPKPPAKEKTADDGGGDAPKGEGEPK